jgi:hypothetical protein
VKAALLLAWFAAHYAYRLAPPAWEADASNMGRSLSALILLCAIAVSRKDWMVWFIALCIAVEEAQVIGCTLLWLQEPWVMELGMERCSEKFSIPLGAIGIASIGIVGALLLRKLINGSTKPL